MSECPDCGHDWGLHAGGTPWLVTGCGECISEEDHGERQDICARFAPEDAQVAAATRLHGRLQRRLLRRDRILIEDELRYRWAEMSSVDGVDLGALLNAVQADLAVLTPIQFAKKYRRWMAPRSVGAAIGDRAE